MRASAHVVPLALTLALLIGLSAAPGAQRGGGRGSVDANGLPLATNTVLQNPDAYYGKQITISAGVEKMLSKEAFVLDQWRATDAEHVSAVGKPILVIAPYLTASFEQRSYVLVRGELMRGDLTALARVKSDYNLDLAPAIWAKYQGQPILLAASVITATYKEVGRKPIPPPTPTEASLDEAMKHISAAFTALRTAAQKSETEVVAKNVAALGPELVRVEVIWDNLGQSPAAEWMRDARARAAAVGSQAAAGDWEAVNTSAGALNQICQNCHAAYRERQDDGTFRIKPGSF